MILSCLSAPLRLLGLVVLAGLLYVGWINREAVRRLVHRLTADAPPPPEASLSPLEVRTRAQARLDSLARHAVDSIVLTPGEVSGLAVAELDRRAPGMADSVRVLLLDGSVEVTGIIDAGKLPRSALGPAADWISGRQPLSVRGAVALRRLGQGEWRIDQVTVRGIPLPNALWGRLLSAVVPGASGSITFPVDGWITGVRVTPGGVILFGGSGR